MSKYWGDSRLKHRVYFERDTNMNCIFCGDIAETREHAPSKVFLSSPLPSDLPTVPSCYKCNNSFSSDELYSAMLIKLLRVKYDGYKLNDSDLERLNRKEGREAKQFILDHENELSYIDNDRLERVLIKLARSHAVYELYDCFEYDRNSRFNIDLFYDFKPFIEQSKIDEISDLVLLDNMLLPEMGAKLYERIGCIQLNGYGDGSKQTGISFLAWNEVKDNEYRYTAFIDNSNVIVKIVIQEFLFAQITFVDAI